ncbi:ABC transporter G family member 15-like protein [Drosera capensis]
MENDLQVKRDRLVWQDLTVDMPTRNHIRRRLLDNLTGYAQPGRTMVILGPSGCGKTTFLDSLAGRLSPHLQQTGQVSLKGRSIDRNAVSYVPQEDLFLGTLTVRETLQYSAQLRLPPTTNKHEASILVEDMLTDMGLRDCADTKIGNWHLRGISGGEKKRLSISIELLTQPYALFLDEPATGLDSAAAYFVVHALKQVAEGGKIVVFSIHQPSSEVFEQFDDLMLLSGGEVIFFGEATSAIKEHLMPSEWSTKLKAEHIRIILISKYKCSEHAIRARKMTMEISSPVQSSTQLMKTTLPLTSTIAHIEKSVPESNKEVKLCKWRQLRTLTSRSFVNMQRDLGYFWLRLAFFIFISTAVGTLCLNTGTNYQSIMARESCDKYIFGFMIVLCFGGIPSFIEEMKVVRHERNNAKYDESIYVLSNLISTFPFMTATSLLCASIIYSMVKFQTGFSYYAFFLLNLFGCIAAMEGCMMACAAVVPHVLMAASVGIGCIGIMIMSSIFVRPVTEMPKFFWRYPMSYISLTSWAVEGQFKNDLLGLEFEPLFPGQPKLTGEAILESLLGSQVYHSKWWDLAAVMFIAICFRALFYLTLKYKERASLLVGKVRLRISMPPTKLAQDPLSSV